MLKRILIPLEVHDHSKIAIQYGVHLAKDSNCELKGLAIIDVPAIEKSIGPVPIGGNYYAQKEEELRIQKEKEAAQKIIAEYHEECERHEFCNEVIVLEGDPEKLILDEAAFHDLVIVSHETSFHYGTHKDKHLHHHLIAQGINPVLLIPDSFREIKKILICYDGSVQAIKTIHEFVQFEMWRNHEIVLLNVNNNHTEGMNMLDRIGDYISFACGIPFEKVCIPGHPEKVIMDYVHTNDIDMLVMGAYGERGIKHIIFGSTTDKILRTSDRPLFIHH